MKTAFFSFLLVMGSWNAFGHGEDKHGPHGGFIRMPGAFHTEVVPQGKDQIKIYLLDIDWKNPSVKDSRVDVQIGAGKPVSCTAKDNHFVCSLPRGTDISKKGQLKVKAEREGHKGADAIYELPLALPTSGHGHGGH